MVSEYRFHPTRKWRADFAHLEGKVLIEIEGGTWVAGRHSRGAGYAGDCEKYMEATLLGWRIIRLTPAMITQDNLERIMQLITQSH